MPTKNRKSDGTRSGRADPAAEKTLLHPRNPHRFRYDFASLVEACPELEPYVSVNRYGSESVDFADSGAVKALNRALLAKFYGMVFWDIPPGYLCPPVPGRADYIHYAADLLASCNGGAIPEGKTVSVLDTGVGANCIYPVIGSHSYGWRFSGSEADPVSAAAARNIVDKNAGLRDLVEIRLQEDSSRIFRGIIRDADFFDLTICNPPFHTSAGDAAERTERKLRNLGKPAQNPVRNFGGTGGELWCPGGEAAFIGTMIEESLLFAKQCFWFTTLVSRRENLDGVLRMLARKGAAEVRTIDMAQGQKSSRIVAWTFFDASARSLWRERLLHG